VQHAAAAQVETGDPVALEPARSASQPAQPTRRPLHPR